MANYIPTKGDYIIVGGGLAGCVLASRLKQGSPSTSVVLIEAGKDPVNHPLTTAPLSCFAAHYSDLDYAYTTVPQAHLGDRQCYASAAKVLSGGSAINYGTWTRGPAADFDHWAEVVQDNGWSYQGLLPYFKKTEHAVGQGVDSEQHGLSGPVHTVSVSDSDVNRKHALREPLEKAWSELGVHRVQDGNAGQPLGLTELVEAWRDGKRQCASQSYDLTGVEILCSTNVRRVIIEESSGVKRATGVEIQDGRVISAAKEVIVSCGAYRTPHILMLSGIGDEEDMTRHGIPLTVSCPEVGQNFHDHLAVHLWWKVKHPEQGLALGTPLWSDVAYSKGLPVDWLAFHHIPAEALAKSLEQDGENIAKHNLLGPDRCHLETLISYAPAGGQIVGVEVPMDGSYITTTVLGMVPTSRGKITLSSSDPTAPPVIDPNYYATEVDRQSLRYGVRQALRLLQDTEAGREVIESELAPAGLPSLSASSTDAEIDDRVRRVGTTLYHVGGSASMGKVVNTKLQVFGVENLRVVDASVIPVPIAAHYQVTVYAIAEKAADLILQSLQIV